MKVVRTAKTSTNRLERAANEKTWEVKKLKSGLLDMTRTPPWMEKMYVLVYNSKSNKSKRP